ncbi:MAG: DNA-binding protein [Kiritimatiellae bacterium]|nr:DNA-binding protein [Kiritimatiellia bacterium]
MTTSKKVQSSNIFMGKLPCGSDLLEELTGLCREHGVQLGRVEALGAVKKACIGFYDQEKRVYKFSTLDQPMEITNMIGNVSIKDDEPFVHAHITLVDETGTVHGGHLAPGTIIFACEFVLEAFDGPTFIRTPDKETGLPLWSVSSHNTTPPSCGQKAPPKNA